MEKIWGGVGENTHRLEKNAKMLEKINTIIPATSAYHHHNAANVKASSIAVWVAPGSGESTLQYAIKSVVLTLEPANGDPKRRVCKHLMVLRTYVSKNFYLSISV